MKDSLQPLFAAIARGNPDKVRQEGIAALGLVLADIRELNRQAKLIGIFVSRYEGVNE
jgi:hypothetical protein